MPVLSLVKQLRLDYPDITFAPDAQFHWAPHEQTVYYEPTGDTAQLLHETGHALLHHQSFNRDISLLSMEREAWELARQLADHYSTPITLDVINTALDTYREWLHARSTCPHCGMTGIQSARATYECPACMTTWRVNDARACGLKRYTGKK